MSLTSTLFNGIASLPGGPYAAAGIAAVGGGVVIGIAWNAINPYPRHERRYRPTLRAQRPGIRLEEIAVSPSPLDIPLDVIPRDEVTGRTPYDIVGGEAIRTAVDRFYDSVNLDDGLSGFFDGVDVDRLKRHQAMLIAQLWGGPVAFPLKALADAHADLSISPEAYWKVVGHLMVTLTRLSVPDWICIFTMTRLYQARSLIVSADNPLDPDPEAAAAQDPGRAHAFSPRDGQSYCSYSVGYPVGGKCGEDETHPVHYAPVPADPPGGQP